GRCRAPAANAVVAAVGDAVLQLAMCFAAAAARRDLDFEEVELALVDHDGLLLALLGLLRHKSVARRLMPCVVAGQVGIEPNESSVFQGRGSPRPCRCT